MKRRNSDEFTLVHAIIVCGVVAIIAIVTTAFLSPVEPALTLETICIDPCVSSSDRTDIYGRCSTKGNRASRARNKYLSCRRFLLVLQQRETL